MVSPTNIYAIVDYKVIHLFYSMPGDGGRKKRANEVHNTIRHKDTEADAA